MLPRPVLPLAPLSWVRPYVTVPSLFQTRCLPHHDFHFVLWSTPQVGPGLVPGCHQVCPYLLVRLGPPAATPRPAQPSTPCLSADPTSTLVSHCLLDLHLSSQNPLNLTENTEQMLSKNCLYPAVNMTPLYIFTHVHRRRCHFPPRAWQGCAHRRGPPNRGSPPLVLGREPLSRVHRRLPGLLSPAPPRKGCLAQPEDQHLVSACVWSR